MGWGAVSSLQGKKPLTASVFASKFTSGRPQIMSSDSAQEQIHRP